MLTSLLKKIFKYKDIGWKEIGEDFIRFTLLSTPWFNIYLHRLYAPVLHPKCHDHPWNFLAIILRGGYYEYMDGGKVKWRGAGSILYRPATFRHNVVTKGVNWSIVIVGRKIREWDFVDCVS